MERPKRILVVDDEALNCVLLEALLASFGHDCVIAQNGVEALDKLDTAIDLVLLDAMMPVMDGFEAARRIRRHATCGDVPIIMVTALTEKADRLRAVEAGANDFITKPVDSTELRVRTAAQLEIKQARDEIKRHQAELEETVQQRTADLRRALETIQAAQWKTYAAHIDTIHRLAVAAEYKDEHTAAHLQRVSHYCALLARGLALSERDVDLLRHASPMHDVGKIGIPDAILGKPGKLTPQEWRIMQQHTAIGARILGGSSSELLQAGELIARSHHEKWDGSGYPNGLAGDAIPLYGRICAVADVFDAITSKRPYKEALPNAEAYAALRNGRGSHFDPHIVDLFFKHLDEVVATQQQYQDAGRESRLFLAA